MFALFPPFALSPPISIPDHCSSFTSSSQS
jgi:hypothetical protein